MTLNRSGTSYRLEWNSRSASAERMSHLIVICTYAVSSLIVHTIQAGRFRFDCTVSLTAVCGQRNEGAVMVFILSKIKCFFRLL